MESDSDTDIARYNFRLTKTGSSTNQQNMKPTVTDFFVIQLAVFHRNLTTNTVSSMFHTITRLSCKHIFEQDHQNFLQSCVPLEWYSYFSSQSLVRISQEVIPEIYQLFDITSMSEKEPSTEAKHHHQDFLLDLEIVVDMFTDGESDEEMVERAVIEESMEEVRMIPASDEAIQGLAKFVLPHNCSICMEEFHGEGVELSPMPCGHVFHHHCIVKWLQTSHVCPLCRHPMPTM